MRPRQWVKNGLLLVAPAAAGQLTRADVARHTAVAIVSFSLVASAVVFIASPSLASGPLPNMAITNLGVRDHVLAAQLFDVDKPAALFDDSAVQPGTDTSYTEVRQLAERLATIIGPPVSHTAPVAAPAREPSRRYAARAPHPGHAPHRHRPVRIRRRC